MSKLYTVWVGGVEVNDYGLEADAALDLAQDYTEKGYTDVKVEQLRKKWSSMYDVAFTVEHAEDDVDDIPMSQILKCLERRLKVLRDNPEECAEAFGVSDTAEVL